MQSAIEFLRELRGWYFKDYCDEKQLALISARDAEWQARVDRLEAALERLMSCVNDDKAKRPMSMRTMSTSRAMDIARSALGREA